MNNRDERRDRYLKDNLQTRLGGLAANLARISSFVKNPANLEAVKSIIEESKFFIEWTAAETEIEKSFELVKLQIDLALLERKLEVDWSDNENRDAIGKQAKLWSKQVLVQAGLI
ncbi:hypothetical protein BH20ACI4_BH20ACI4_00030 [soil metagenome]